jgi:hypothetical protein
LVLRTGVRHAAEAAQELRLAKIKTVAAANRFLQESFVRDYNARFRGLAAEPGSGFVALCRACVSWPRRSLQITAPALAFVPLYARINIPTADSPSLRAAVLPASIASAGKPRRRSWITLSIAAMAIIGGIF